LLKIISAFVVINSRINGINFFLFQRLCIAVLGKIPRPIKFLLKCLLTPPPYIIVCGKSLRKEGRK
jgi:hypothetical protein